MVGLSSLCGLYLAAMSDLSVFDSIASETTGGDKRTLLALLELAAQDGPFTYLEIGSHLGGSLQPFIQDQRCVSIISIDPRPASQPDDRPSGAGRYFYRDNSTDRMRELLAEVPGADMEKLRTIEASTDAIDPATLPELPALCFIDGEHTHRAALRDALFCATVAPTSLIAFHDRGGVGKGIRAFMDVHGGYGNPLPDTIFAVDLSGRGRTDHLQQRPWLWKTANRMHLAGQLAATTPVAWRAAHRVREIRAARHQPPFSAEGRL